ncbi:hypothetical protein BDY19DRAFT_1096590 [Irpex rosettiformis]|uniref:Uncharacterized protein n=1 Tax=Irpex rosettiformis TaxID=378272 RepID=A0ACB8TQB8_9APHY|nr:hypothetical protein BDY19DRAFT_1096590 [Irpex rosettiformis]
MPSPSGLSYIFRLPLSIFSSSSASSESLSYSQPPATDLLVLLSFLFLLNVVKVAANYVLNAGIIAEIILGAVYGTPLSAILPQSWEVSFTALGYLGLIGLVFEGGLSTDIQALLSNLPLSFTCAVVGVALPISFSFALLQVGFGSRSLEAFAAGSALASTSLGTTLMALDSVSPRSRQSNQSSTVLVDGDKATAHVQEQACTNVENSRPPERSLQQSRIGTVLISAAVIDDVIGLVLVSLVPALAEINAQTGPKSNSSLPWTIIRPILASILMALVTLLVSRFVLRPLFWFNDIGERWCAPRRPGKPWGFEGIIRNQSNLGWGTRSHADAIQLTLTMLTISAFSVIAFYTGSSVLFGAYTAGLTLSYIAQPPASCPDDTKQTRADALSFEKMYSRTIGPLQDHFLAPLFFASIGFSIPFRALWRPVILWRGILYSILMCIAKLATGIPVLCWSIWEHSRGTRSGASPPLSLDVADSVEMTVRRPSSETRSRSSSQDQNPSPSFLLHLAPALFMGSAMVSRGEIGLLVVQIAHDPQSSLLSDDTYLIAIWAILLCTLTGPIMVGILVKRWNRWLQTGIWR